MGREADMVKLRVYRSLTVYCCLVPSTERSHVRPAAQTYAYDIGARPYQVRLVR